MDTRVSVQHFDDIMPWYEWARECGLVRQDEHVRRIVIDITLDQPVVVHVERFSVSEHMVRPPERLPPGLTVFTVARPIAGIVDRPHNNMVERFRYARDAAELFKRAVLGDTTALPELAEMGIALEVKNTTTLAEVRGESPDEPTD